MRKSNFVKKKKNIFQKNHVSYKTNDLLVFLRELELLGYVVLVVCLLFIEFFSLDDLKSSMKFVILIELNNM